MAAEYIINLLPQGIEVEKSGKSSRASRRKLRVIDLQNTSLNIWTLGYIVMSPVFSAVALPDRPAANHHPERTEEPPFRIFTDVVISDSFQECVLPHLLQWAETRKGRVQLCCERLQIESSYTSISISKIESILRMLHLDSIQELVVDVLWNQENMENMVPYLVQMKNLRILSLTRINLDTSSYQFKKFYKYIVQVLKEKNLQELHIRQVLFLYGKLHKVLRILKPLTTLSLSNCSLMEADLRHLSQYPCTSQLKHLHLRNVHMGHFSAEPLRALVERVAGTVETLAIEHCEITDAQLSAILPTLSQCSQLRLFSFFGNPISTAALQNLLRHTARLSQLSEGLYPAPLESYDHACFGHLNIKKERLARVCESLLPILRDSQANHEVHINTNSCALCEKYQFHSLAPSGNWEMREKIPFSGTY
ncbi:PRAME family member 12-like [Thomomys bottae]